MDLWRQEISQLQVLRSVLVCKETHRRARQFALDVLTFFGDLVGIGDEIFDLALLVFSGFRVELGKRRDKRPVVALSLTLFVLIVDAIADEV